MFTWNFERTLKIARLAVLATWFGGEVPWSYDSYGERIFAWGDSESSMGGVQMTPCSSYFISQRMKDQRRELSYRSEVMKGGCNRRGSVLANLKDFPVTVVDWCRPSLSCYSFELEWIWLLHNKIDKHTFQWRGGRRVLLEPSPRYAKNMWQISFLTHIVA